MKRVDRENLYIKLTLHPKFYSLPEKLQEVLDLLAAGATDKELSKKYKVSHGTPWSYRESIFKRFGFIIWLDKKNSHTQSTWRVMNQQEILEKLAKKETGDNKMPSL